MKMLTSRKTVISAVCCIIISPYCAAQDTKAQESNPPPPGYVMKFERMGGYAGTYDQFWIYPDGQVVNSEGKAANVTSGVVAGWNRTFSPVAKPGASAKTLAQLLCFDCFVYRLTLYGQEGPRVVSLAGPLKEEPDTAAAGLAQMRDRLLRLFTR